MKRAASGSLATSPASIALVDAVRVIHQPNVDAHTHDYRVQTTRRAKTDFWLSTPFETSDYTEFYILHFVSRAANTKLTRTVQSQGEPRDAAVNFGKYRRVTDRHRQTDRQQYDANSMITLRVAVRQAKNQNRYCIKIKKNN